MVVEEKSILNETSPKQVKSSKSPVFIIFLILIILGLVGYIYLLKNNINIANLDIKNILSQKGNTEKIVKEEDTVNPKEETTLLKNEGWAFYSIPKFGLSVEIPEYRFKQTLGSGLEEQEIYSYWTVKYSETGLDALDSLKYTSSDYKGTVNINFYPSYIPPSHGCGQGCVKEHSISIDVYQNLGAKTFVQASPVIVTNLEKEYKTEDSSYTWKEIKNWGINVGQYTLQMAGGGYEGYFVVKDKYIYDISYFFSSSPKESADIAQKVLDSILFTE